MRETCTPGSAGGGRYKARPRPPSTQRTDPERLKAYYYLLQIAHLMLRLLERGSLLRQVAHDVGKTPLTLWGSLKNIARRLLDGLRHAAPGPEPPPRRIQIRLNDSS